MFLYRHTRAGTCTLTQPDLLTILIYIYILLTLVDDTYIKICFYLLIILLKLYDEREEYDFSRGNISFKSRTIYDSSAHRVVVS